MNIEAFFPQDDICAYKKSAGSAKNPYQRTSAAAADSFVFPQYINSLDSNLFDIVPAVRPVSKKPVFKQKKTVLQNTVFFTAAVLCIFVFSVYYTAVNMRSRLKAFEFAPEISAYNAMHDYAFPVSGTPEAESLPTAIPASFRSVEYKSYTVGKGDTISGIAKKFGLRNIGTIFSANDISNARRIMNGEKLIIPSMDGVMYKVKKGDNLSGIASQFGISMEAVLDANDLNDKTVSIGQTLFIPGASLSIFEIRKAMGELFIYPIKGRLTSPFGYRADPFTGRRSFHSGIDLAAAEGTSIKAVLDGRVSETGFSRIFGNYIIITHSGGYQSLYGHLSKFKTKRGNYVTQGEIIGLVGNTGMSTGPHVHFSVYKNGKLLNPLSVLK